MEEYSRGGDEPAEKNPEAEKRREQRSRFGPWVFNVDKAQSIIAASPREARRMPVMPWAYFYGLAGHEPGSFSIFGPRNLDEAYALTTDLSEPVIIATVRNLDGAEFSLLIDGTHRLYRAYVEEVPELSAHVLTVEETLAIREDGLVGGDGKARD